MAPPKRKKLEPPAANEEECQQLLDRRESFEFSWDTGLLAVENNQIETIIKSRLRKYWKKHWPYFPKDAMESLRKACGLAYFDQEQRDKPKQPCHMEEDIDHAPMILTGRPWLFCVPSTTTLSPSRRIAMRESAV